MPEGTAFDSTDKGTLRPLEKPITSNAPAFKPMEIPYFPRNITLPAHANANDPISIFDLYYTPGVIEEIVRRTNNCIREPPDLHKPYSRANAWHLTCPQEISVFLGIRIYMTIVVENEIADYWSTTGLTCIHPFTSYMSRNRFQELHLRFRLWEVGDASPYEKVYNTTVCIQ